MKDIDFGTAYENLVSHDCSFRPWSNMMGTHIPDFLGNGEPALDRGLNGPAGLADLAHIQLRRESGSQPLGNASRGERRKQSVLECSTPQRGENGKLETRQRRPEPARRK